MADEDTGASADAESPMENDIVSDEEETAAPAEEAVASADAEATPAEAEPEAEAGADAEPEAAAEPDAAAGDLGDSASAEAPAKRKKKRLPRALRPQKTRPKPKRAAGERKPIVRLEKPAQERGRRQERQGTVVSDAMEKTIVVEVAVVKAHPKYKKVVRRSVKFHAHDERSEAKVGDLVRIVETRPLSKTKRWRLAEILQAAK